MRKRKWLRLVLIVAVSLLAASAVLSRALQTVAARRYLITRLAASFGRPVDVARFDFSLLDGARLEAHALTVAEDPRFGNEYFLRADTLTAGLRWWALLLGRFEFGSLSLFRPSLNLVRDADGQWNIERWLPPAQPPASSPFSPNGARPGFVGPPADFSGAQAARLYRIDVNAGRINFKQRDDKSPFALLDVSGRVERDNAGHWQLDLEARPMRAGVELQDIGTVRLRGTIAGTSARLQPAELNLTWRAASLADALRIARQQDYGIRGQLSLDLNARVGPPDPSSSGTASSGGAQWTVSGVVRLAGIHAWNLTGRADDPSANVSVDAGWRLGEARAQIRKLSMEMAGSHLQGMGDINWSRGFHPQVHIASSTIAIADILSWYRSLHPEVAEDLRADGMLGVDVTLGGWPLQLQQGAIASAGGTLASKSLPALVQIGAINASVSRGGLDFAPTEFSFSSNAPNPPGTPNAAAKTVSSAAENTNVPESSNAILLRGSVSPDIGGVFRWPPNWDCSVEGATPGAEDWLTLSGLLAQPLNSVWTASGGLSFKMHGTRRADLPSVWLGTLDFRNFAVSPAFVNQPVQLLKTHVDYGAARQTITVLAAKALGANWHGTLSRKSVAQISADFAEAPPRQWTFDLTADHLDAAELDRWLGPRARPGFMSRFTSFGSNAEANPLPDSAVARMSARGRLRAGEIVLTKMRFEQFDGEVELDGRAIKLRKGQANFFGGKTSGTLDARLLADPSYEFQGRFDRVNLAQLARAVPWLNDFGGGTASATLSLSSHGIGKDALIAALQGKGTLDARDAEIRGLDFNAPFSGDAGDAPLTLFKSVQGGFQVQNGGITLADLALEHSRGILQADGRIEFSHTLNIRVRSSISRSAMQPASTLPPGILLGGTIESPAWVSSAPPLKSVARSSSR
jgi:AsmA-like C-terminal region/AsmA family